MRFVAGRGAVAESHRESAAGRSSLHGIQCGSIGKQLRVDAEIPDAGRHVEKRRCRNAGRETPTDKHKCSNATLERYYTKAMRSVGFCVSHAAQEIR